jgi:actin-related protein
MIEERREHQSTLVVDNGSSQIRIGFSGYDNPQVTFPTIVGKRRGTGVENYGDSVIPALSTVSHPITNRVINDFDQVEKLLRHGFEQLNVDVQDKSVMTTEPINNPKENREKMMQTMFETFNVAAYLNQKQPVLSLYAVGKQTGVVLDIGEDITDAVSIVYGSSVKSISVPYGGKSITDYLTTLLHENGKITGKFGKSIEHQMVKRIKESTCVVSLIDTATDPVDYELPNGEVLTLGEERAKCTELLFKPEVINIESSSLFKIITECIVNTDADSRGDLYKNIVVTGGSSQIKNLVPRLTHEIGVQEPTESVNVSAAGPHAAWLGGSILASLNTFMKLWVCRPEYEESGPSIVHRRFG